MAETDEIEERAEPDAGEDERAVSGTGEERLAEQVERLAAATQLLVRDVDRLRRYHPLLGSVRMLLWRGFVYGILHGLGYAMGASVILAAVVWFLGQLRVVPVLGEWIAAILEAIESAQ